MASSLRHQLLGHIHSSERHRIDSGLFREPTEVVRLTYIGAPDYFITDRGYVYNRKTNGTNRAGILTRGYLPMTPMDIQLPYPWVFLPTDYGTLWFPINQLLGWSFTPTTTIGRDIYITKDKVYTNNHYTDYEWVTELPSYGFFKAFMTALYR